MRTGLFFLVAMLVGVSPAMAGEALNANCETMDMRVNLGHLGLLDEGTLRKELATLEAEERKYKNRSERRQERRQGQKQKLAELRLAMQDMRNARLAAGCPGLGDDPSMEARLTVINKGAESASDASH